ncbi:Phospholipase C [Rhizina undulata]
MARLSSTTAHLYTPKDPLSGPEFFDPRLPGMTTIPLSANPSISPPFMFPPPTSNPSSVSLSSTGTSLSSSTAGTSIYKEDPIKQQLIQSKTWPLGQRDRQSQRNSPAPSPDALRGRQNSTPVAPLSLPLPVGVSAMSDALNHQQQKQPSLMRRVSQKAANKLRRRTSSTSHDQDERSGPVLMRHRGDSISGGESGRLGIQKDDSLYDDDEESAIVDHFDGNGDEKLGRATSTNTNSAGSHYDSTDGAVVPEILQKGTAMTRVTRKKKTQRLFKLEVNSARVSWDPAKPSSRFYVDDIKEIRVGRDARNYREEFQISAELEDRWATIIYAEPEDSGKLKTLHVIAPTVELFTLWTTTLEKILRYRTEMMAGLAMQGEKFVDAHWRNYMASQYASAPKSPKDERLSFEDVERLCRRLHVNCSRRFLKDRFKRSDRDNSGYLNFKEFRRFVELLKERDEIKDIWQEVVANKDAGMNKEEFRTFLSEVQKVDLEADSAHVDKVFRKFCRQSAKSQQTEVSIRAPSTEEQAEMRMSMDAFSDFLLSSSYNPPLLTSTTMQNLDRPLNEYFISSSHNTYLLGRQVAGESSVEAYIRVLQRGCRCVEIDCWDGDDGRPVVTHGHTGTSEVLFSDVISAIAKYAFLASPYPLILSLEVHCSLEQQVVMAGILRDILDDKLVTEPFMTNALTLPSPQELKHRILVKVKGSTKQEGSLSNDINAMEKRHSGSHISFSSSPPKQLGFFKNVSSSGTSTTSESEDVESGGSLGEDEKKKKRAPTKIAPVLGALGVYSRGQKFRNFALPESKTFNHIFSFQEKAFEKFCKDSEKKMQLEKHNVRYLMRVYPSGFRVNSSNFDPNGFWRRGVQMVALNWQTYDLGLQMNEAMFASADDRTGYVLKPKELRGSRTIFDPPADAAAAKLKKDKKLVKFSVEVISAQQLPRPKDHKADGSIDPFVVVEVFSADEKTKGASTGEGGIDTSDSKGVSGLGAPHKRRTKVVRDDGFHPLFREKMSFSVMTKFESLVFVRFSVYNADGSDSNDRTLIATYTAKLISLQQGYRHLPLYDLQGEQFLFSTIFVKINVEPVTIMDREMPLKSSTMETLKTTAKSVLSRSFSTDRNSLKRKNNTAKDSEGSSPNV